MVAGIVVGTPNWKREGRVCGGLAVFLKKGQAGVGTSNWRVLEVVLEFDYIKSNMTKYSKR